MSFWTSYLYLSFYLDCLLLKIHADFISVNQLNPNSEDEKKKVYNEYNALLTDREKKKN